jgi:hypothetical protein
MIMSFYVPFLHLCFPSSSSIPSSSLHLFIVCTDIRFLYLVVTFTFFFLNFLDCCRVWASEREFFQRAGSCFCWCGRTIVIFSKKSILWRISCAFHFENVLFPFLSWNSFFS